MSDPALDTTQFCAMLNGTSLQEGMVLLPSTCGNFQPFHTLRMVHEARRDAVCMGLDTTLDQTR
jgi:hypothetical protein